MRSKGLIILVANILAQIHSGCYNLFFCHQSRPSLHQWLGRLPLLPWHRQHCFASTIALFYHTTQFNRILELLRLVPLTPTQDTALLVTQAASFATMAWVVPPFWPSLPELPQVRGRFFPRTKVQLVAARQASSMCHMKSMFGPLVWPFYQS